MRLTLTFAFILSCSLLFGQNNSWHIDSIARNEAHELLNDKAISEVLIYTSGCTGCYTLEGDCQCSDGLINAYLIWKANNTYIKKYDCCSKTDAQYFKDNDLLNELIKSQESIFSSSFIFDYITPHDDAYRIGLITNDSTIMIRMSSVHFDPETEHYEENMVQPAKLYLNKLKAAVLIAEKSGFKTER